MSDTLLIKTIGDTEYIISSGYAIDVDDEDFRLEIIDDVNWFDVFLKKDEMKLLREMLNEINLEKKGSDQDPFIPGYLK